jgi:hypothetical protein
LRTSIAAEDLAPLLANVFNEPQPDANSMRLSSEIQRRPQAFSNLKHHPMESSAAFAPSRKKRYGIAIVQQSIELPPNRLPLPWALRLMRAHVALQPRLLGAHQSKVKSIAWRMPGDFPRIAQIVRFQRGSDLVKKIKTPRRTNSRPDFEKRREYGIDERSRRKEARVIAQLRVEAPI